MHQAALGCSEYASQHWNSTGTCSGQRSPALGEATGRTTSGDALGTTLGDDPVLQHQQNTRSGALALGDDPGPPLGPRLGPAPVQSVHYSATSSVQPWVRSSTTGKRQGDTGDAPGAALGGTRLPRPALTSADPHPGKQPGHRRSTAPPATHQGQHWETHSGPHQ
jgi:hypothetical protein